MKNINWYEQGLPHINKELFGAIGALVVSPSIHEEMGMPITSEPGDIWLVSLDSKNKVNGFLQARACVSGQVHIRYLYGKSQTVKKALIKELVVCGDDFYTNARKSEKVWAQVGFKLTKSHHGEFYRMELNQ